VKLIDPFDRLEVQSARLEARLPGAARIYTWFELERSTYQSFQTTRALLLFIMAMIVMVAAVNVSSGLIMVVLERRMEIGILKSIGRPAGSDFHGPGVHRLSDRSGRGAAGGLPGADGGGQHQ
jgi:lipoprotein-releasing system permease protein